MSSDGLPARASRFQIRRQPNPACLSTLESIHLVIEQVKQLRGLGGTEHDALLEVFDFFVDQQIAFAASSTTSRHAVAKAARAAKRGLPMPERPVTYPKKRWRPVR